MDVMTEIQPIQEQFAKLIPVSDSFQQKRQEAFESFLATGFPKKKHEEYRYLNLSHCKTDDFVLAEQPDVSGLDISQFLVPNLKSNVLVFVDGFYQENLSSIIDEGAFTIGTLQDLEEDTIDEFFGNYDFADYNPFSTLNLAFAQQGAYIDVPKGQIVDHPIQLLNVNTGVQWVQPFHLIILEENAQAKVIENYFSLSDSGIDNTFLRIVAKPNAVLDHYKLQIVGEKATHIGTTHIEQKKQSVCSTHVYNLGGGLVRNNIHIDIEDDHTTANMYGLYVTDGNEVVDNHTLVNHMKPHCDSNQIYKGIMNGHSKATFNGKIFVQRDAQVTNAYQSNRNLVISNDASINTKPQLEIWADDVKCSHGATIGKLSKDEIFYLKSRGIKEEKAISMLTYAFAADVLTYITIPELREFLEEGVAAKMNYER